MVHHSTSGFRQNAATQPSAADVHAQRLAQFKVELAVMFASKGGEAYPAAQSIGAAFETLLNNLEVFHQAKRDLLGVQDFSEYKDWSARYKPGGKFSAKDSSLAANGDIQRVAHQEGLGSVQKLPIAALLNTVWKENLAAFDEINRILGPYFKLIEKCQREWIFPDRLEPHQMKAGIIEEYDAKTGFGTARTGVASTVLFQRDGASHCFQIGDELVLTPDRNGKVPASGELIVFRANPTGMGERAEAWCSAQQFRIPEYCTFSTAQEFAKELGHLLPNSKFESSSDMAAHRGNLAPALRLDLANVFSDAAERIGLSDAKVDAVTRVRGLFESAVGLVANIEGMRSAYCEPGHLQKRGDLKTDALEAWKELLETRKRLDDVIGTPSPLSIRESMALHDAFHHLKRTARLLLHVMDATPL